MMVTFDGRRILMNRLVSSRLGNNSNIVMITIVLKILWVCIREYFYIVNLLVRDRYSYRSSELGLLTLLQFGMYTFGRHWQFSTLDNRHLLLRLVTCTCGNLFDFIYDLVAFENLSEDDVLAIEPAVSS